jgi:heme A synthase
LGLLRHSLVISALLVVQIALGVAVILTGTPEHKRFWITNLHVINGLALLATAFALAVRCWTAGRKKTLLAEAVPVYSDDSAEGSDPLPRSSP